MRLCQAFRRCVHDYHPEDPSNEDFDAGPGALGLGLGFKGPELWATSIVD